MLPKELKESLIKQLDHAEHPQGLAVDAMFAIQDHYGYLTDKGVQEAMEGGVLAGYPVVDCKATLYDGSYHDVDSSEIAFKIAGSMAFRDGAKQAGTVLLEPVMKVEVVTPEEYMGDVNGDLNRRRGVFSGNRLTRGSEHGPGPHAGPERPGCNAAIQRGGRRIGITSVLDPNFLEKPVSDEIMIDSIESSISLIE